ncbi:hypothetical protein GCM10009646_20620 [Streptomyces aureus]
MPDAALAQVCVQGSDLDGVVGVGEGELPLASVEAATERMAGRVRINPPVDPRAKLVRTPPANIGVWLPAW